jgi:hypothetical protein
MDTVKFSCNLNISTPEKPLDFKILLDDTPIYEIVTEQQSYEFSYDIPEDNESHVIKFIMDGKTDRHTVIDENNNIVESAQVEINNVSLEDIDLTDLFLGKTDLAVYTHNGNGYSDETTETFDFCMGCNGTAEFAFSTPIYLWLLENM